MYLLDLEIQNLRFLRDFKLSFQKEDGTPYRWTVLIGENGMCKTTLLRAIAAASKGYVTANQLADAVSWPDRRNPQAETRISGLFQLGQRGHRTREEETAKTAHEPDHIHVYSPREYPGLLTRPSEAPRVRSELKIRPGFRTFRGSSHYEDAQGRRLEIDDSEVNDPVSTAAEKDLKHWFVAGYGTQRELPRGVMDYRNQSTVLLQLQSLFDRGLISTGFMETSDKEQFLNGLRDALVDSGLLPMATAIDLGQQENGSTPEDLEVGLKLGNSHVKVPASWMSLGYQSVVAWVADLIGQHKWGVNGSSDTRDMEGLVLIDEIDLHLHPSWQVLLIPVLKKVFPRMQFIVTTHSPLVLPGLDAGEIVVLQYDENGNITGERGGDSPKLMTGSELYSSFFGIDKLYPIELGEQLRDYGFLVGLPNPTDEQKREMVRLKHLLVAAGVDPGWDHEAVAAQ